MPVPTVQTASTDLEEGEITDEATLGAVIGDMGEAVIERDQSSGRDGRLDEDQLFELLEHEHKELEEIVPKPNTSDVETLKSFDGSEERSGTDSSPHLIPTSVLPSNSIPDVPLANPPCALSEEELEIAKDVVLDLLGLN
ncbi:hypothetical protein C0995_004864 [Termitomyces sp. Mi166|nr:hypothetical protein C0995_004864 [Termitomyces sp. Mi166\